MQTDELTQLIANMRELGTDLTDVEAKASGIALPKSVKESLSAFANTSGGTIILGVAEEDRFAATGVTDPAKISTDLASMCSNELDPPLRPVITQHQIDGAWLVVAEVPELEASQKPCFVKARGMNKGSYIRVHDGDQAMSAFEVQMLLSNRGQPTDDIEPVPNTSQDDLDSSLVEHFISRARQLHPYAYNGLDAEEVLKQGKILVLDSRGDQRLSVGGLLALGRFPQSVFPQLTITFVHYPTERGADVDTGVRFLDNVTLEGPIPVMARDVLAVLRRNMRRRSTVAGIGRTDTWEYPEAALREAVVNALVHRDLSPSSRGTQIQIEMYPDRLVIKNPGGLFGPVSVSDLTEDGISSARNSFLLKILEDVVLPGEDRAVCENRGSGIRTMVGSLRDAGMSIPRFEDKIASFLVTFPNHTLLDDQTIAWLKALDERGLTDSQCVGLALLRTDERLDNARYRAATGLDSRVATTELQDLVTRELVIQVGSRRWTEYRLSTRVQVMDAESSKRLSPRDRRPIILGAFEAGPLSRADIEAKTGLSKKVVIRWLGILRKERLVQTVGGVSVQNSNVKYERTPLFWGQEPLDFEFSGPDDGKGPDPERRIPGGGSVQPPGASPSHTTLPTLDGMTR